MNRMMLTLLKIGLVAGVSMSLVLFYVLNREEDHSKSGVVHGGDGSSFNEPHSPAETGKLKQDQKQQQTDSEEVNNKKKETKNEVDERSVKQEVRPGEETGQGDVAGQGGGSEGSQARRHPGQDVPSNTHLSDEEDNIPNQQQRQIHASNAQKPTPTEATKLNSQGNNVKHIHDPQNGNAVADGLKDTPPQAVKGLDDGNHDNPINTPKELPRNREIPADGVGQKIPLGKETPEDRKPSDQPEQKTGKQPKERQTSNENVQKNSNNAQENSVEQAQSTQERMVETMNLAVVACGDRLEETIVMLKSAVLLSFEQLHFYIFAEDQLQFQFRQKLDQWPQEVKQKFKYDILSLSFPGDSYEEWKKLFKPCASQRLFLPDVLKDVEKLVYVDTDILFLRPLDDIWAFFSQFNSTQIAALAPEHEDRHTSWYARFARHPYYPPLGVNSGVMLMHLDRMRDVKWLEHIGEYYKQYKLKITWGDQDLINIFFHFYPDKLYVYPCQWNYRPDHCMYMPQCRPADQQGISIVHGNRGVYHNEKQPVFKAVYEGIRDFSFDDVLYNLPKQIKANIKSIKREEVKYPGCFRVEDTFTKMLIKQIHLQKEGKSDR